MAETGKKGKTEECTHLLTMELDASEDEESKRWHERCKKCCVRRGRRFAVVAPETQQNEGRYYAHLRHQKTKQVDMYSSEADDSLVGETVPSNDGPSGKASHVVESSTDNS